MPKRSSDEKLAYYQEKIRKLARRRRRRRRIISSSSDSELSNDEVNSDRAASPHEASTEEPPPNESDVGANLGTPRTDNTNAPQDAQVAETSSAPMEPELDPEVLSALGAKTDDGPEYGDKIHENLAQLWLPLLKKGIPKDDKDKLLKQYLVPQNCTLLQAPKLNPEISAALTDSGRNRDKKLLSAQQQLGSGITAINRAMDALIGTNDKLKAIKHMSDACRILSDLHYTDTQARIKLITPSLDKSFLNIIQDACRDDSLFGAKLSDKIKASKAIEKQGLQIKKPAANPTPSTSANPRATQARGNWTAPPRYHKSGRGGSKKTVNTRRAPTTTSTPAKPAPKPQTRSQTTH